MSEYTVTYLETNEELKAIEFYHKLWKCLRKAMSSDELACHCNNIVVHLGKSVESNFTYYNETTDKWCDYFLS